MRSDGILGNRNEQVIGVKGTTSKRIKWLKRRERWLVVLGVILHAIYMLSIFDIYFKSPIVHGVDPVPPRFSAPAKRLVLLVGMYAPLSLKIHTHIHAHQLFDVMFISLFE
jgi:phosphatidylinositol glycan class N